MPKYHLYFMFTPFQYYLPTPIPNLKPSFLLASLSIFKKFEICILVNTQTLKQLYLQYNPNVKNITLKSVTILITFQTNPVISS